MAKVIQQGDPLPSSNPIVCRGAGVNALHGAYYLFKSQLPARQRWICAYCGRRVWAQLEGQRGHWEYRFEAHPRRGVTDRQWETAQLAASHVEGRDGKAVAR